MNARLVVLARAPEPGRVKTRLAAAIGDEAALAVYRTLLDRTAAVARAWPGPVELHVDGDPWLVADTDLDPVPVHQQSGRGLGARLAHAARHAFRDSNQVVVLGADCADVTVEHVAALASILGNAVVALGPARDGGYWGAAIRDVCAVPVCFADDLPWSTDGLLATTRSRLAVAGLSCALGPTLDDIDDVESLRRAEARGFRWNPPHGPERDSEPGVRWQPPRWTP